MHMRDAFWRITVMLMENITYGTIATISQNCKILNPSGPNFSTARARMDRLTGSAAAAQRHAGRPPAQSRPWRQ